MSQAALFSPEFELLLLSARSVITADENDRIIALVESDLDWMRFLNLTFVHQVYPIVFRALDSICRGKYPESIESRLAGSVKSVRLTNAFLTNELGRIQAVLANKKIDSLALKGAVLAHIAYGSVSMRPFADLDILVAPDDFQAAKKAILHTGYMPFNKLQSLSRLEEKLYLWQSRQYQFSNKRGLFNIDLHLEIMPPLYDFRPSFRELYSRSQSLEIAGTNVRSFGSEDMLFILSFHCVKNRWEKLKHVADLAEFVRAESESFDWQNIVQRAQNARCTRILNLSLCLASRLLGAPVPDFVISELSTPQMEIMVSQAIDKFPTQVPGSITPFAVRLKENLLIQDTLWQKFRYLRGALVRRIANATSSTT